MTPDTDTKQAIPNGPNTDYQTVNTAERARPTVAVPSHVVGTALRMAENAVNEIVSRICIAEQERDQLARRIGVQQDQIDRLNGEREYRSRLVRELKAATDA